MPNTIKSILGKYPLFIVTILIFFLLHNNNFYFSLIDWSLLTWDIIIYLLCSIILCILLTVIPSGKKAGVLSFGLLVIFYFFQSFHDFIKSITFLSFLGRYSILLPLVAFSIVILCVYLKRTKNTFTNFYYLVNSLMLVLILFEAIQFVLYETGGKIKENDLADPLKQRSQNYPGCDTCVKPDIYLLVFDEYANSKTLEREFGYSNRFILDALSKRGFYIVKESKSNYNFTHMSLASVLNFDYLANLDTDKTFHTREFLQAKYTVYKNELTGILHKEGYRINNYSLFDLEGAPTTTAPFLSDLHYRSIFGQTFFRKLSRDLGYHFTWLHGSGDELTKSQKKIIATDINRLHDAYRGVITSSKRKNDAPHFTYAHFMLPHTPYYYDSNGNRLSETYSYYTTDNKSDYVNYIAYANRYVITPLVDSILIYNKRPVIIIIQGDHGYRSYPPQQILLEMENFCAIYFFDQKYNQLYETMSSVNVFRIILNNYFNQQFPLLKDSVINLRKSNTVQSF